jgi:hypothetical protein
VIFSPKGAAHTLIPKPTAEMVCAEFEFGQRFRNPLTLINPGIVLIPLKDAPEIGIIHGLLMNEAFSNRCGKSFGVNQLLQYFVLVVFRYLIRTETLPSGIAKALADDRLLRAITSMHTNRRRPGHSSPLPVSLACQERVLRITSEKRPKPLRSSI